MTEKQKWFNDGFTMSKPQKNKKPEAKKDQKNADKSGSSTKEKSLEKQSKSSQSQPNPEKSAPAAKKGEKAASKSKKGKKKEDGDLDDALLDNDEDVGGEEIPDLSEFDIDEANQEEEESSETTVILATSEESTVVQDDEIILTDAEGRRLCRVRDCDQAAIVEAYCRYHYLQNWKRIQIRRGILAEGKFERYVEELTSRYPDKFLEVIKKDLRTEKDFLSAIAELEIDESAVDNDFEDESQNYIEEVRGVQDAGVSDEDDY